MRKALLTLSAVLLISGTTGAAAASTCNGDFVQARGDTIANSSCVHGIATRGVIRDVFDPAVSHVQGGDEYCRWHQGIETDVYCAPYRD